MYEILEYVAVDGVRPFAEWVLGLKDKRARAKIRNRITRAGFGNFGNWKTLENAGGICEMREHYGPDYRIFYKRVGGQIILLLAGAAKKDQDKIIEKAKQYLADYQRRSKS